MTSRKDVASQAGVRAEKAKAKQRDAEGGWAAYRAEAAATAAKSSRLRALRLARDAEQQKSAEPASKKPKG
jgi:hypothetical protein